VISIESESGTLGSHGREGRGAAVGLLEPSEVEGVVRVSGIGSLTSSPGTTTVGPEQEVAKTHAEDQDLAKLDLPQLLAELEIVRPALEEQSTRELVRRFEAGLSEFISTETTYKLKREDFEEIAGVKVVTGIGVYRTVLPRDEFKDLYALKARSLLLEKMIDTRRRESRQPK
jgi:hypothetical protein